MTHQGTVFISIGHPQRVLEVVLQLQLFAPTEQQIRPHLIGLERLGLVDVFVGLRAHSSMGRVE